MMKSAQSLNLVDLLKRVGSLELKPSKDILSMSGSSTAYLAF